MIVNIFVDYIIRHISTCGAKKTLAPKNDVPNTFF